MKECNCLIGILKGNDKIDDMILRMNDYVDKIEDEVSASNYFSHMIGYNVDVTAIDYFDRRKSLTMLFDFCPYCGNKINWDKIKERLN